VIVSEGKEARMPSAKRVAIVCVLVAGAWLGAAVARPHARAADQPKLPRTAWGDPDFQTGTWNFATMTPLERPRGVEGATFTEEEAAAFEKQTVVRQTAATNNGYDWWDEGTRHLDRRRTSLIVDPPDGRIPPLTPEAQQRVAAAARQPRAANAEGPESFPLNTRCLWWTNAGPPMIPSPYNDNIQFVQTRDAVVIYNENIHDTRIVPLGNRPHGSIRQWLGDSRGRWEGSTLVIDTINFSPQVSIRGSDQNLHVIERFTETGPETMDYQFTVEDPTVWTRPWTAQLLLRRLNRTIYEFACHEGNELSMEGLLQVARFMDKKQGK
jgi:hypothetical protein